jgi:outer membrane receptor protein involved in Fe transport
MAMAGTPAAIAQQQTAISNGVEQSGGLEEIIVTAQKREENLQSVPMSIQALSSEKLEQLHVQSFDDYAKYLPNLTFQTTGPGTAEVIMRGVPSNHLQPTVATYFDEQSVSMVNGTLDVHIYDVARIEALAGPQGTLYGSSSEAGTLRIITNKPDPTGFKAAYDVQGSQLSHGSGSYQAEGFVNVPVSPAAAVRLVAWTEHDGGYIDNVPATHTYGVSGVCIANTNPAPAGCVTTPNPAKRHFNEVDTSGGRAALRIGLDDSWTVTPAVMEQTQRTTGIFGFNPALGDLNVSQFYPDRSRDQWTDASLTVQGKIGNFDLVYAGAFLKRDVVSAADYSDYSVAYDGSLGAAITDDLGRPINPSQVLWQQDHYKQQSHELRISSPKDAPLRVVAGLFIQRLNWSTLENFHIDNLAQSTSVPGWPDTWFLADLDRLNRDSALFSEVAYDISSKLTATAGVRYFKSDSTLHGFLGQAPLHGCIEPGVDGAPCDNLAKEVSEKGHTPKVNLSYHFDAERMVYATYAKGFRPGGINNIQGAPAYKADYLTSYEIGWKTSWAGNRLRFNGAIYQEDWKDFQFTFKGTNGITIRANAGQAQIRGIESDLNWAATASLLLSGGFSFMDPKTTATYCGSLDANGNPITNCAVPLAPSGTQLPGAVKFKGNVLARYMFKFGQFDAHLQSAIVYQSASWPDLHVVERQVLGQQSAWGTLDLSGGVERGNYALELFVNNALDKRAQLSRYAECATVVCAPIATYIVPNQPRAVGLKFAQKF